MNQTIIIREDINANGYIVPATNDIQQTTVINVDDVIYVRSKTLKGEKTGRIVEQTVSEIGSKIDSVLSGKGNESYWNKSILNNYYIAEIIWKQALIQRSKQASSHFRYQ